MRRVATALAVALALGAATSAQGAVSLDQKQTIWTHACLATGGQASIGAGRSEGIVACSPSEREWNAGTVTKLEQVCLSALRGTFFDPEAVVCLLL